MTDTILLAKKIGLFDRIWRDRRNHLMDQLTSEAGGRLTQARAQQVCDELDNRLTSLSTLLSTTFFLSDNPEQVERELLMKAIRDVLHVESLRAIHRVGEHLVNGEVV